MRRLLPWIAVVVILLALASLACNVGGKEEPTPTPVPPTATPVPPTETAEPTPTEEPSPTPEPLYPASDMVPARSETHGVALSYPEGWLYEDSFFVVLSSDPDLDLLAGEEEMPEAVIMFVITMPAEDVESDFSEDTFAEMVEDFSEGGEVELLGTPEGTTINGVPAQVLEFRVVQEGNTFHGEVAMLNDGVLAAIVVGIGPEELWDEHGAAVDAILESIELFEGAGFEFEFEQPSESWEARGGMAYGDTVSDELGSGAAHAWTFKGLAGEYATVALVPFEDDMDVAIQLVDPAGTTLVDLDDARSGEPEDLLDYELPADGEYTVVVREYFGEPGGYELELIGGEAPVGMITPPGAIEMGEISIGERFEEPLGAEEEHVWFLAAEGGELVSIVLEPGEGLDLILTVYAPDGTALVDEQDSAFTDEAEEVDGLLLYEAGTYLIVVQEYYGEAGDYSVAVDHFEQSAESEYEIVDLGEITYGDVMQGTLAEGQYIHVWSFQGTAGDVITIIVTPQTAEADLQLALVDPYDEFILDLDEGASDDPEQIVSYELVDSGTFSIVVAEYWEVYAEYGLALTVE